MGTKPFGMKGMLEHLSLELKGRHHSGIDDCRNIAQVVDALIKAGHGALMKPTGRASRKSYRTAQPQNDKKGKGGKGGASGKGVKRRTPSPSS